MARNAAFGRRLALALALVLVLLHADASAAAAAPEGPPSSVSTMLALASPTTHGSSIVTAGEKG